MNNHYSVDGRSDDAENQFSLEGLSEDETIGTKQMASLLGVTESRAIFFMRTGRLKATKTTKGWRIKVSDARKFVNTPRGSHIRPQRDEAVRARGRELLRQGKSWEEVADALGIDEDELTFQCSWKQYEITTPGKRMIDQGMSLEEVAESLGAELGTVEYSLRKYYLMVQDKAERAQKKASKGKK